MQYFKHMSNMRHDIKIKRLISRYGLEGYGLYNLILESIVEKLTTDSPLPDLQETCEDMATFYNGNTARINEIANFMINQGLLELDEVTGFILCSKIYKFLESSQTRSEQLRQMIAAYKKNGRYSGLIVDNSLSETVTDFCEEEKRIEENRTEQNKPSKELHPVFKVPINRTSYDKLVEEHGQVMVDDYIERVIDYVESSGKKPYLDYAAAARNFIKNDKQKKKGDKDDVDKELEQWRNF